MRRAPGPHDGVLDAERFDRYQRTLRKSEFRAESDKRIIRVHERANTKNNVTGRRAAMRSKGRAN